MNIKKFLPNIVTILFVLFELALLWMCWGVDSLIPGMESTGNWQTWIHTNLVFVGIIALLYFINMLIEGLIRYEDWRKK